LITFAIGYPAGLNGLAASPQTQRIGRYIFCDAGGSGDVSLISNVDRGYECRVGAYEGVVANVCLVFMGAVVIAGDGAGAYVYAGADGAISQIRKVVSLGAAAHSDFLCLYEVADVGFLADFASWAEVGVRP
jgi:hypothetical protein